MSGLIDPAQSVSDCEATTPRSAMTDIALEESGDDTPDCYEGNIAANIAGACRIAYADPPYPGQSQKHYGGHPDFGGEVDHCELLERLREFDGWALSTSMVALRDVLSICPPGVLVAAWVVTDSPHPGARPFWWWYSWEPVIVSPARKRPDVKNVLSCSFHAGSWLTRRKENEIIGMKPPAFSHWLFDLLGLERYDEFHDLFPGSGAVTRAWESWRVQTRLAI